MPPTDRGEMPPHYAAPHEPRATTPLAHEALDAAVAAAYAWTDYTPQMHDEEILRRLLALNCERAASTTS
jgi:hypothetical protein